MQGFACGPSSKNVCISCGEGGEKFRLGRQKGTAIQGEIGGDGEKRDRRKRPPESRPSKIRPNFYIAIIRKQCNRATDNRSKWTANSKKLHTRSVSMCRPTSGVFRIAISRKRTTVRDSALTSTEHKLPGSDYRIYRSLLLRHVETASGRLTRVHGQSR